MPGGDLKLISLNCFPFTLQGHKYLRTSKHQTIKHETIKPGVYFWSSLIFTTLHKI